MPNSSNSDQGPNSYRLRLLLLSRPVIGGFLVLLAGLVGLGWWSWIFIHEELAPTVAANLTQLLNRPVELGAVEGVSFTGLRFGNSRIPAFSQPGGGDQDSLTVPAIEVGFNPWDLLVSRTLNLDVTLKQPQLKLLQSRDGRWLRTELKPQEAEGWFKTNLQSLRFQDARATAVPYQGDARQFQDIAGTIFLSDGGNHLRFDLGGSITSGGTVKLRGEWDQLRQGINLALQAQNLDARFLNGLFTPDQWAASGVDTKALAGQDLFRISSGEIDGQWQVQLRPQQAPDIQGTAQVQGLNLRLANVPQPLRNLKGEVRFQGLTAYLAGGEGWFGEIPLRQMQGTIAAETGFNLNGQIPAFAATRGLKTLEIVLPVPVSGKVQVPNLRLSGPLFNPQLSGTLSTAGVAVVDRVPFRAIAAQFRSQGEQTVLSQIRALPAAGGELVGDAIQRGEQLQVNLRAKAIPAAAIARLYGTTPTVELGAVSGEIQAAGVLDNLRAQIQFQAPDATYPTWGTVLVSQSQVWLRDILTQVEGGTVASNGVIQGDRWQLRTALNGIALWRLDPQLRGQLTGHLDLAGSLANLSPETTRAAGELRFSQGLATLKQPLTALVGWDGENVQVRRATAPGFLAQGTIFTRWQPTPQIRALDLRIQAQDYELRQLALTTEPNPTVQVSGRGDFQGRLQGSLANLRLVGGVRTRNLGVNQLYFEPSLSGSLAYSTQQGLALQLAGRRDRLDLNLAADFLPNTFFIRRDQTVALGQRQGNLLQVEMKQFPLLALNLRPLPQPGVGPLSGEAAGNFSLNLKSRDFTGQIAIERPGLAGVQGDRFAGNISFSKGVATLSRGELSKGNSRYLVNARMITGSDPQVSGRVAVTAGQLHDLVDALQVINPAALGESTPVYGTAADVQTLPVGDANASLLDQIQRLDQVQSLLAQQQQAQNRQTGLPGLEELQGIYSGQIDFATARTTGLQANFEFQGQELTWGTYKADQTLVRGKIKDKVVTLQPLQVISGAGIAQFKGTLGGERQQGLLVVENFPVEAVRQVVDLPGGLDLQGKLNAQITINGSFSNPQAQGALALNQATLNGKPLENTTADFNYRNARLDFKGKAELNQSEPIQAIGSLPYKLPFASREPADNRVTLALQVKDSGLSLLNLFTDQLAWVDGQGSVNLKVNGTLNQPTVEGLITLDNATLQAQALEAPLTAVTGRIRFDRDRLFVEQLGAKFQAGDVTARGGLAIAPPSNGAAPRLADPLTLSFQDLKLQLANLYTGTATGAIIVSNALLSPALGGKIQLREGRVLLTEALPTQTPAKVSNEVTAQSPLRFNHLQVSLGDNIQISRPRLFNFLATGNIALNGTADNLQPEGEVRFQRGQVNLFTSSFRLNPTQPNFARFLPAQGLDPTLNINLITTATEVSGVRLNPLNEFEPPPTASLGTLNSIRVTARVNGRASQLETNFRNVVDLSSSPARSNEEILALLGGGSNLAQSQQNPTLALVNLAGSAFFNNIGNLIDNYLGNRVSFRLFPTLIPTNTRTPNASSTSIFALGAEVGYDITDRLSVSALQLLTAPEEPTRFNFGYQLNDRLRLSTSINLDGDAAGLVEYRIRF